jgi:DNA polymerase-3 subunit gamma/tau
VLATTDPQKVRPTILSRTQHFKFRLLPPDVLSGHVRHVIEDAGLGIDPAAVDQAVDHVVRAGGGSARDTLSALDQVAALGAVVDEAEPVDAILDALADRDAGRVLVGVAQALAAGRDPRGLGETLIAALRDAFLALMGAADDHLAPASRQRAAELGERFGAPGLTRALDVLGEALTELSRKPDPRIVVEVALVRLTQPSTDRTLEAVLERLDRLERNGPPRPPGAPGAPGTPPEPEPKAAADPVPATRGGPAGSSSGSAPSGPGAPEAKASGGQGGSGASAARDALTSAARRAEPPGDPPGSAEPEAARRSGQPTLGAVTRGRTTTASPAGGEGGSAHAGVPTMTAAVATSASPSPGPAATSAVTPSSGAAASSAVTPSSGAAASSAVTPSSGAAASAAVTPSSGDAASSAVAPSSGDAASSAVTPSSGAAVDQDSAAADVREREGGGDGGTPAGAPAAGGAVAPAPAQIEAAWVGEVLPTLPVKIRSKWRGGRWIGTGADGPWQFAVPNAWHQGACDEARPAVERALGVHFGHPVTVAVVVDGDAAASAVPGAGPGTAPPRSPTAAGDDIDEHVDLHELRDADDAPGNGVDLVLREFGGGQVVEEDP